MLIDEGAFAVKLHMIPLMPLCKIKQMSCTEICDHESDLPLRDHFSSSFPLPKTGKS